VLCKRIYLILLYQVTVRAVVWILVSTFGSISWFDHKLLLLLL